MDTKIHNALYSFLMLWLSLTLSALVVRPPHDDDLYMFSAYSAESLQDFCCFCLYMIFLLLMVHQHSSIQNVLCIRCITHHIIIHMVYTVETIFLSMHFIFVLSSHRAEPCKANSRFSDAQSHVLTSQIAKLLATECPMFIASAR